MLFSCYSAAVTMLVVLIFAGIFKHLIELWGDEDSTSGFNEFTHKHIIPACLLAPTKDTFDWRDAQTVLVSEWGVKWRVYLYISQWRMLDNAYVLALSMLDMV